MDVLPDRPEKLTVAELIALKQELAEVRKGTKKVRAWLAVLGIPEEELPTLTNIRSSYTVIDEELVRYCPSIGTRTRTNHASDTAPASR